MRAVAIIPARLRGFAIPGKPLVPIAGRPLVQRVYEGACAGRSAVERVVIATDDERIAAACRGFGAEVAMTGADHPTGTDRIAEVAAGIDDDVVVNVQGDEPLIEGRRDRRGRRAAGRGTRSSRCPPWCTRPSPTRRTTRIA